VNGGGALPLAVVASSLVTGIAILPLGEERVRLRTTLNMVGAVLKLVLVGIIMWGSFRGHRYEATLPLVPGIDLVLRVDFLALLFVSLSAVLWLLTTVYAIGYLARHTNRSRFFAFFSFCVTSTMGIALAGNLLTFFVFYEMLTVVTYPLVVHQGTEAALSAGRVYLLYTLAGGVVFLLGVAWLQTHVGGVEFVTGGALAARPDVPRGVLVTVFVLLIAGLGVKAALIPLHGWLPLAMVAPAPVSALLHAVAVVKAGAFGIVRVVYDVFGIERAAALGVLTPLAVLASVSILYGSLRALAEDDLKRRLAYSTVSQLSYITLGTAVFGPMATTGGLVHLMHQGLMKITLFFCVGAVAETLGLRRASQMAGVGRRMPVTMVAFTVAAFGMIGVPPLAGFISKWHLGLGGIEAGQPWVLAVLAASGVLNAAYFLPVIKAAWFLPPAAPWPAKPQGSRFEADPLLVAPALVTAALVLGAGLLAGASLSPLGLTRMAVAGIYGR
jgi:multicomponent Na+:H+ antiporter subunit D